MKRLILAALLLCITSSTAFAESTLESLLARSEQAVANVDPSINGCNTNSLAILEGEITTLEEALTAIGSPSSNDAYSASLVSWNINGLRNFVASCR